MKIFDSAAGVIEQHFPAIVKRVEKARLFLFPARPQDVLPKDYDAETLVTISEQFFLPFPTVAVEDAATCTIMWDTEKDQAGLGGVRGFIEIQPFTAESVSACREADVDAETVEEMQKIISKYPQGSMLIAEGRFGPVRLSAGGKIEFAGVALWVALATKADGIIGMDMASRPKDRESLVRLQAPILANVDTSLQEVFYFNSPERFILEDCPVKAMARWKKRKNRQRKRRKLDKAQIRRRHERPVYTLLRPNEIRAKLGLPPLAVGGPQRPHERRRHYRTYRDDRYTKMKGKTVVIPATWVGPSDAEIGNRRYRILLDK